jgi:hypothetical protein
MIEDQKIVVGWTTTTRRARKSWAKKPASKYSFIQHRNEDYSNDLQKFEKGERGCEKFFPLFPFSNLFYLFLILSNAKVSKNRYAVEKEKRKWWIWGWERKFKCKWWKNGGKENGITAGLPPDESFTFIVHEQDCLHTFED